MSNPTPSRYQFELRGTTDEGKPCVCRFDTYRLAEAVGIKSHPQFHAFKKLIRAGQSVKSLLQDIDESIACSQRWREMVVEDAKARDNEPPHCFRCGKVAIARGTWAGEAVCAACRSLFVEEAEVTKTDP